METKSSSLKPNGVAADKPETSVGASQNAASSVSTTIIYPVDDLEDATGWFNTLFGIPPASDEPDQFAFYLLGSPYNLSLNKVSDVAEQSAPPLIYWHTTQKAYDILAADEARTEIIEELKDRGENIKIGILAYRHRPKHPLLTSETRTGVIVNPPIGGVLVKNQHTSRTNKQGTPGKH